MIGKKQARMTRDFPGGSHVHNVGAKADRDRAVILRSYHAMCEEFRIRKSRRLSPREIAAMTNAQLFQASKDLYNGATVKQAKRLARKLGVSRGTPGFFMRMSAHLRNLFAAVAHKARGFRVEDVPAEKPADNSHLLFVKGDGENGEHDKS